MAVAENPVLAELNNLNALIGKLNAEIKAKQGIVKGLKDEVTLAEADTNMKVQVATAHHAEVLATLKAEIVPLEAQKAEVARLKNEIASLKQQKADQLAEIKASKNAEIADVQKRTVEATKRLEKVHAELAQAKAKIAAL